MFLLRKRWSTWTSLKQPKSQPWNEDQKIISQPNLHDVAFHRFIWWGVTCIYSPPPRIPVATYLQNKGLGWDSPIKNSSCHLGGEGSPASIPGKRPKQVKPKFIHFLCFFFSGAADGLGWGVDWKGKEWSCAINMEVAIRSPIEYQETLACNHLLRKEANYCRWWFQKICHCYP